MTYTKIPGTNLEASRITLGCMRISEMSVKETSAHINNCLELGINFFDHADIYGGGKCEELFGEVLKSDKSLRSKMIIQSKCGIRSGFFDFSKQHILNQVDVILKRLQTDYLDALLLHRPDTLMEPEEVAEAFELLHKSGKVKYFGVSNQNPMQIQLLQKYVSQKLVFNQLQFSVTNTTMIDNGVNVNMGNNAAVNRDGSVLEYCRLNDITIQAWSPFQHGFFAGAFLDNPEFETLNKTIDAMAKKYDVTNSAIAVAWILRHPANMQVIIGSTNQDRIKGICKAAQVVLSREEWYEIYRAAGNILP